MTEEQALRVEQVRRFFQYAGTREWAAASGVSETDAPDQYRTEARRMQADAAALVAELIAGGEDRALRPLLQSAKADLLLPVLGSLTDAVYAPAVPWLVKEYRGAPPRVKQALLRFFAATGSAEAVETVWEELQDASSRLHSEAANTLAAICSHHPALALLRSLTAQAAPVEPWPEPREVAHALLKYLPLQPSLVALGALCRQSPGYAELVQDVLAAHGSRTAPKEADGVPQRALLLLGSQAWALPPDLTRLCSQSFHKAGGPERSLLVRSMPDSVVLQHLRHGLTGTSRKAADQTIAHLQEDRPDLVPALGPALSTFADAAESTTRAQVLLLVADRLPEAEQERLSIIPRLFGLSRLSETRPLHRHLFAALLRTARGRDLLVRERMEPYQWEMVTEAFRAGAAMGSPDAFLAAVAETLSTWAILDSSRLNWFLSGLQFGRPGEADTLLEAAARSVSAHLLFSPDPVFAALLSRLQAEPSLWLALAGRVTGAAALMPPERRRKYLEWLSAEPQGAFAGITSGLDQLRSGSHALLEGLADLEAATPRSGSNWLEAHPERQLLQVQVAARAESMQCESDELRRDLEAREATVRGALADAAVTLIEGVAGELERPDVGTTAEAGAIGQYLTELEDSVVAFAEARLEPLPTLPSPTGPSLRTLVHLRIAGRALADRQRNWEQRLRAEAAQCCGLPIEKMLLAVRGLPEAARSALTAQLAAWLSSAGLAPVEPDLGHQITYRPERHQLFDAAQPPQKVTVLTWGLASSEGAVLRKALVCL